MEAVGFRDSSTTIRLLSTVAGSGCSLPSPVPGCSLPSPVPGCSRSIPFLFFSFDAISGIGNRCRSLKGGWINGPWTLCRSLARNRYQLFKHVLS